jgi:ribonucleotide reductase beta subunit family protein with ferritin-like domain
MESIQKEFSETASVRESVYGKNLAPKLQIPLATRYSLFPIKDQEMYKQLKKQEAVLWTSSELDFSADKDHYNKLNPKLKHVIDIVNCFFSATDGLIVDNIVHRFLLESKTLEEQSFFILQAYIELVHSETYSLIINTLVSDEVKRNSLFTAANDMACVRNKNLWMEKYLQSDCSLLERRLAYCCTEGIFFISSFLFIFYFRSMGILPNIIFANELISKDESIHLETGTILYRRDGGLPTEIATKVVSEAVELECQFVDEVLPEKIDDLMPDNVKDYVRYLGDLLLSSCGHPKVFNINLESIPTWIRDLSLGQKGNFYEVRTGNYMKFNYEEVADWETRIKGDTLEHTACSDPSKIDF